MPEPSVVLFLRETARLRSRVRIGWVAAIALSLLATSCTQCGDSPDRSIDPVVFGLMDRLKPEGAKVLTFSGLRHDRSGVHAAWEVETGMDWSTYSAWVKGRVPPDFKADSTDGSSLVFRKSMPADFYVLRFEPIACAPAFRVRASFDGYPN